MNSIIEDEKIEIILRAIIHNKMISFDYLKDNEELTSRVFIPLDFTKSESSGEWRVFGWCSLRKSLRAFRHDKIFNISIYDKKCYNKYIKLTNGNESRLIIILKESEDQVLGPAIVAKYNGDRLFGNMLGLKIEKPAILIESNQVSEEIEKLESLGFI